ncbi:MAG: hypothetical protein U0V70_02355 [Terriglobia bacterium]
MTIQHPLQTGQPLLLRPRALKFIVLAIFSFGLFWVGVWMIRDGDAWGWLCAGFFGLCFLVFMALMHPKASYLELTPEGFTICSLFRAQSFRWADVAKFEVGLTMGKKMVMFNFVESYSRSPKLRSLSSGLTGFEAGLPDSYGLKYEELAELMNQFRAASKSV